MSYNFNQLKNSWNKFGINEPFWSVLTQDKYKSQSVTKNLDSFFTSGLHSIQQFEKILNKHNSSFKNNVCLDFGCGVGRLTQHLSSMCKEVYGVDISSAHLKIAEDSVKSAKFFLLDDVNSFPKLPQTVDIIISNLVLQHNRTDLIFHFCKLMLNILRPQGLALLHIPYHIENHINYNDNNNRMEMHFVPKKQMISKFHTFGCKVESIVETKGCGPGIKDCIYVVRKI